MPLFVQLGHTPIIYIIGLDTTPSFLGKSEVSNHPDTLTILVLASPHWSSWEESQNGYKLPQGPANSNNGSVRSEANSWMQVGAIQWTCWPLTGVGRRPSFEEPTRIPCQTHWTIENQFYVWSLWLWKIAPMSIAPHRTTIPMSRSDTQEMCPPVWYTRLILPLAGPAWMFATLRASAITGQIDPWPRLWCTTAPFVPFFVCAMHIVALCLW